MAALDYDAACRRAATAQGLDPLTAALAAAGVPYGVEQTGGFCMVVTVQGATHTYAVIRDGAAPREWLLGAYLGDAWREGGAPDTDTQHTLDALVDILRDLTREIPPPVTD